MENTEILQQSNKLFKGFSKKTSDTNIDKFLEFKNKTNKRIKNNKENKKFKSSTRQEMYKRLQPYLSMVKSSHSIKTLNQIFKT